MRRSRLETPRPAVARACECAARDQYTAMYLLCARATRTGTIWCCLGGDWLPSYERRLRRSRLFWDRASGWSQLLERAADGVDTYAVDLLGLREGDTVADIGCGAGAAFRGLRGAVGVQGRVVGIDHSSKMLERAQRLVTDHGWRNVEVREGDFARCRGADADVDAAVAIFSLSAMTDVYGAVKTAHAMLRPGGRLLVADARFEGRGVVGVVAAVVRLGYQLRVGSSGHDPLSVARMVFPLVTVQPIWGEASSRVAQVLPISLFVAHKEPG